LHKASVWSHEQEWRLICQCNSPDFKQVEFSFSEQRPTALYLGRKISTIHEKILRHIAVDKNIPVYKMETCGNNSSYIHSQRGSVKIISQISMQTLTGMKSAGARQKILCKSRQGAENRSKSRAGPCGAQPGITVLTHPCSGMRDGMRAQRECRLSSRKHYGEAGFRRTGGPGT